MGRRGLREEGRKKRRGRDGRGKFGLPN